MTPSMHAQMDERPSNPYPPITPAKPSLEHGYRWNRSIQYEAAPLKSPPSVCAQAWKMQAALLLIILSSIT